MPGFRLVYYCQRLTRVSQLVIVITVALCLFFWLKIRMSNYSLNLSTLISPSDISSPQVPVTTKIFNSLMTDTLNISSLDANFTNNTMNESKADSLRDFYIGLFLAIGSTVFIGSSFIFKKLGLLKLAKNQSTRAGQGGYGYLKEWLWWTGMILMIVGEFSNFAAYAFAPASMVTPLGAISVLVSAVLSSRFLKERLNLLGKIGCTLCILGSTVMVLHSPKEQEVANMEELLDKIKEPMFIVFGLLVIVSAAVLMIYFAPRYGSKNVLVYVAICSVLGSFTVMACKGVGVAIKETFRGRNEFTNWLTWVLLFVVVACILVQLNYLNKALDTYNTAVVTPIYYVFFTSSVIVASVILFKEFGSMSPEDIVGDMCGFLTIIGGIFLLHAFKDLNISLSNLPKARKEDKPSANGELLQGGHLDEDHRILLDEEENIHEEEESVQLVTEYRDDPDTFTESYRP